MDPTPRRAKQTAYFFSSERETEKENERKDSNHTIMKIYDKVGDAARRKERANFVILGANDHALRRFGCRSDLRRQRYLPDIDAAHDRRSNMLIYLKVQEQGVDYILSHSCKTIIAARSSRATPTDLKIVLFDRDKLSV